MGVSYAAKLYVGFLVDPSDLFVDTALPTRCSQGHEPKAGEAFCPLDGGRFEARVSRVFREPVARYLRKHGLRVDPDDFDGWLHPRKGYEGIILFDARAQTEPDDRSGKVLALGYRVAEASLDDRPQSEPRAASLSELETMAAACRRACDELEIARAPEARVFLTAYCGY